jgi:hypothetical protein
MSEPEREPDALDLVLGATAVEADLMQDATYRAIRQRFLALGAAIASLEARVIELEQKNKPASEG